MKNSDDSTSFHFIRPLPLPPIIYATIDLCFDSYLPIDALNEIIGLQATEAAPRSAMRINPLTGKQNPGYWIYKLPPMRDFDSMDLTEQLNMVLTEHETGFRKAMQKYEPAELILRFYSLMRMFMLQRDRDSLEPTCLHIVIISLLSIVILAAMPCVLI